MTPMSLEPRGEPAPWSHAINVIHIRAETAVNHPNDMNPRYAVLNASVMLAEGVWQDGADRTATMSQEEREAFERPLRARRLTISQKDDV